MHKNCHIILSSTRDDVEFRWNTQSSSALSCHFAIISFVPCVHFFLRCDRIVVPPNHVCGQSYLHFCKYLPCYTLHAIINGADSLSLSTAVPLPSFPSARRTERPELNLTVLNMLTATNWWIVSDPKDTSHAHTHTQDTRAQAHFSHRKTRKTLCAQMSISIV